MISVVQLGQVDYGQGLLLQRKLVDLRKARQIDDVLLILEHAPPRAASKSSNAIAAETSPFTDRDSSLVIQSLICEALAVSRQPSAVRKNPPRLRPNPYILGERRWERSTTSGVLKKFCFAPAEISGSRRSAFPV